MARNYDSESVIFNRPDISEEINKIRRTTPPGGFKQGVVLECFKRIDKYPLAALNRLAERGASISKIRSAPPNSILVMPIEGGAAHHNTSALICYPMLSHIKLPIKVGECVWYYTLDETPAPDSYGYWLSRIVGELNNEDSNYTHFDRYHFSYAMSEYPNGARTPDTATIPGGPDAYNDLVFDSEAMQEFNPASAPRYPSPASDNVFNGSHRNLVRMGDIAGEGFVDIVAGAYKPPLVTTSRGWEEMDKSNPLPEEELEIGWNSDKSRVTIFENLSFDSQSLIGVTYSNPRSMELVTDLSGSHAVVKADNIRFWGNKSVRIGCPTGQLIIEERAAYLDSEKVIIGKGTPDSSIDLGDGANEQAVLGNELNSLLSEFIDTIGNIQLETPFGPIPFSTLATVRGQPPGQNSLILRLEFLKNQLSNHLSEIVKVK